MTQPPTKRRAGRTAVDGAVDVKRVSVTLEEADHEKVRRNGGSPWVRGLIRAAPEGFHEDVNSAAAPSNTLSERAI